MTFEQDYNKILKEAKSIVFKGGSELSPTDLISEAYLRLLDSTYSFKDFKKSMYDIYITNVRSKINFIELDFINNKQIFETTAICKYCKEEKPTACFSVYKHIVGRIQLRNICKDCKVEYNKKYNSTHKHNPKQSSEYYKNYRASLPDGYIIDVLKRQGNKVEDINKEMIKSKRVQILEKRSRKGIKINHPKKDKKVISNFCLPCKYELFVVIRKAKRIIKSLKEVKDFESGKK